MADNKLLPRNRTARLAAVTAAGNPVSTDLASGVGNCFPGLEFDARNLDRRFFPYLTVDFSIPRQKDPATTVGDTVVAAVDVAGAEADAAAVDLVAGLRRLAGDPGGWRIARIRGEFAGYDGQTEFVVEDLGIAPGLPADDWTAARLIRPGSQVTIILVSRAGEEMQLTAQRVSYLQDDGAFAAMFEPGELTQSLCSPWTHDFRDCGCFYWASNHPDIVQPAVPAPAALGDPAYDARVSWLRADRITAPPPPDPAHQNELRHHEINRRWQELDVVLDGREQHTGYAPDVVSAVPLPADRLLEHLRYAAGVELAVMLEYLAAAYSLSTSAEAGSVLADDIAVARYEVLRVAQSEMRHLKAVNALLLDEHQAAAGGEAFRPALGIATHLPAPGGTQVPSGNYRALTHAALEDFVQIEAPSKSVDALYGRILATYQQAGRDTASATIAQIMAEGADHYFTFRVVEELLARHDPADYLITDLSTPHPGDAALAELQGRYETMIDHFYNGYAVGLPDGRSEIATARAHMQGPTGVEGACESLANQGILPVFAVPTDPRFAPVDAPGP